ncbi:hypothetical protein EB001_04860 [bacterium]|nr:hypothetical protein [bacterium]
MSLYVNGLPFWIPESNNFNLYVSGLNPIDNQQASVNMFTINYAPYNQGLNQQTTITWNGIS